MGYKTLKNRSIKSCACLIAPFHQHVKHNLQSTSTSPFWTSISVVTIGCQPQYPVHTCRPSDGSPVPFGMPYEVSTKQTRRMTTSHFISLSAKHRISTGCCSFRLNPLIWFAATGTLMHGMGGQVRQSGRQSGGVGVGEICLPQDGFEK